MGAYIGRRLIQCVIVVVLVSVVTFFIMHFLPGDPLAAYVHDRQITSLTPEAKLQLEKQFGLDKSVPQQYVSWMVGIFHGDFGYSFLLNKSAGEAIKERFPVTLYLGIVSFIISAVLGAFLGTICAIRRGKWIDTTITALANLGITMPAFWVGILLIYVLALKAKLLPVLGFTSPFTNFGLSIRQMIMPVICLALPAIAGLTRQTRSSVLEVVHQDYIRTAWSKGLRERTVVTKHIVKNGFIPVVTILGMILGQVLSGAVLIETVFNIPGLGQLLVNAVTDKDYVVVQIGTLIMASSVVLANLLVDISYGWFDPRIRYN